MHDKFCPFCGYGDLNHYGYSSSGKPRYYCKYCQTSFVDKEGEELSERELELLSERLFVEVSLCWVDYEVDLEDRVERSIFCKIPQLPISDPEVRSLDEFCAYLAPLLNKDKEDTRKLLYKAIARMMQE